MYQEVPPYYTEFIPALTHQPYNHTLTYCIGYSGVFIRHCFICFLFFSSGNRTPGYWWTDSYLTQEVSDNIGNIGWWWNNLEHSFIVVNHLLYIYTQHVVSIKGLGGSIVLMDIPVRYMIYLSIYMYLQPPSTNPGMEPTQAWKPIKTPLVRFLHLTPARSSHSNRLMVTLQEPDQLFIRLWPLLMALIFRVSTVNNTHILPFFDDVIMAWVMLFGQHAQGSVQ